MKPFTDVDYLNGLSDDDLLDHYRNAITTHNQCGGHNKASRNELLADTYAFHIAARKLELPELYNNGGVFNGTGSS